MVLYTRRTSLSTALLHLPSRRGFLPVLDNLAACLIPSNCAYWKGTARRACLHPAVTLGSGVRLPHAFAISRRFGRFGVGVIEKIHHNRVLYILFFLLLRFGALEFPVVRTEQLVIDHGHHLLLIFRLVLKPSLPLLRISHQLSFLVGIIAW